MRLGVIGSGSIFKAYVAGAAHYDDLELVAVADLDAGKAARAAAEFGCQAAVDVASLLARDDIDCVVNLTIPAAHAAVDRQILAAGKHAYSEKPLALSLAEIAPVRALAAEKGLHLACAPDTFLGGGLQTCRQLIDSGAIGQPLAAVACMAGRGHEYWHPSPAFYYQPGGGPLFDMGPYYLTALVSLMGPVTAVGGMRGRGFHERLIHSQPLAGSRIAVAVDTHYSFSLRFESGAIATLLMSFDVQHHSLPRLEIYGSEASLLCPDPNTFGGPVLIGRQPRTAAVEEALRLPTGQRGAGLADLAIAIRDRRPPRASLELASHVLEIMQAMDSSGGDQIAIRSRCLRPTALPPGLAAGAMA